MPQRKPTPRKRDDREDVFLQIIDELSQLHGSYLEEVAEEAGVALQTLYNWREEKTLAPQIRTLFPVARALGYEVRLVRTSAKLRVVR